MEPGDERARRSRPPATAPPTRIAGEQRRGARRAAIRRRRARLRLAAVAAALIALVIGVAVALTGSSGSRVGSGGRSASIGSARSPGPGSTATPAGGPPSSAAAATAGTAVDGVLRHTSYVRLAGRRRRDVALTFDDGPGPFTARILRILRRTHTPATFFLIGRAVREYPHLVAAEVRDGSAIGDHTETHPSLAALPAAAQNAEIDAAAAAIHRAGAPYPRLFRPPYGSFNAATLAALRARRMLMVLWSSDTKDFSQPGTNKIIYAGISAGQPGAIVLMHDGGGNRSQTVAALPRIISRLRQRGFSLVTIPALIADDPPPAHQPAPRPLSAGL